MTNIADFRAAERELAQQLAQLENMQQDAGLQQELVFSDELKALMKHYRYSAQQALAILQSAE